MASPLTPTTAFPAERSSDCWPEELPTVWDGGAAPTRITVVGDDAVAVDDAGAVTVLVRLDGEAAAGAAGTIVTPPAPTVDDWAGPTSRYRRPPQDLPLPLPLLSATPADCEVPEVVAGMLAEAPTAVASSAEGIPPTGTVVDERLGERPPAAVAVSSVPPVSA